MKPTRSLVAGLCGLVFAGSVAAQLKAPRELAQPPAPAPAAAPASSPETTEKENAGRLAAQGWLSLLDRRDWGTAWEASSAVFRSTVPLATWMDGIPKVRESAGNLVERAPSEVMFNTKLEGRPDGEYVSVLFASRFDKEEIKEIVTTVREADGRWRVTGYSTR